MSDVKRYAAGLNGTAFIGMLAHPQGDYVLASEYDALAAELAEANSEWEALDARLPAIEDWEKTVAERDALRAAIEDARAHLQRWESDGDASDEIALTALEVLDEALRGVERGADQPAERPRCKWCIAPSKCIDECEYWSQLGGRPDQTSEGQK